MKIINMTWFWGFGFDIEEGAIVLSSYIETYVCYAYEYYLGKINFKNKCF